MRINNYVLLVFCIAIPIVYHSIQGACNPAQRVTRTINSKPGKIRSGYDTLYALSTTDPKDFFCTFAFEENREKEMHEFGKQLMQNNILSQKNPVDWVKKLIILEVDAQRLICKRKVFEGMLEQAQAQQADAEVILLIEDFLAANANPNPN
jgi:hypothetical protein